LLAGKKRYELNTQLEIMVPVRSSSGSHTESCDDLPYRNTLRNSGG